MRSASGKTGTHVTPGPWSQIYAIDAICPDGVVRRVRVGTPDTMWSCPGRTRVAGINVAGSVYMKSTGEHEGEWLFAPKGYAKNYAKLAAKLGLPAQGDSTE